VGKSNSIENSDFVKGFYIGRRKTTLRRIWGKETVHLSEKKRNSFLSGLGVEFGWVKMV